MLESSDFSTLIAGLGWIPQPKKNGCSFVESRVCSGSHHGHLGRSRARSAESFQGSGFVVGKICKGLSCVKFFRERRSELPFAKTLFSALDRSPCPSTTERYCGVSRLQDVRGYSFQVGFLPLTFSLVDESVSKIM